MMTKSPEELLQAADDELGAYHNTPMHEVEQRVAHSNAAVAYSTMAMVQVKLRNNE